MSYYHSQLPAQLFHNVCSYISIFLQVNNAGIGGSTMNHEALKAAKVSGTEVNL